MQASKYYIQTKTLYGWKQTGFNENNKQCWNPLPTHKLQQLPKPKSTRNPTPLPFPLFITR